MESLWAPLLQSCKKKRKSCLWLNYNHTMFQHPLLNLSCTSWWLVTEFERKQVKDFFLKAAASLLPISHESLREPPPPTIIALALHTTNLSLIPNSKHSHGWFLSVVRTKPWATAKCLPETKSKTRSSKDRKIVEIKVLDLHDGLLCHP